MPELLTSYEDLESESMQRAFSTSCFLDLNLARARFCVVTVQSYARVNLLQRHVICLLLVAHFDDAARKFNQAIAEMIVFEGRWVDLMYG